MTVCVVEVYLGTLLLIRVHNVRIKPTLTILLLCLFLVLLDGTVVHHTGTEQQVARKSGLSRI